MSQRNFRLRAARMGAGVQKAPRHEVVGSWEAGSERYGDLMSAPRSIVGGTPARRHVHVRQRPPHEMRSNDEPGKVGDDVSSDEGHDIRPNKVHYGDESSRHNCC